MKDEAWLQNEILRFRDCLAQRLLEWRRDRDLSQDRFADLAGISRTALTALERGCKEPRIGTLIRLARAMDMSVETLISEVLHRMNPGMLLVTLSTVT